MKRLIGFVFAILVYLVLLNPTNSYALSCAKRPTSNEAYQRYDAVVVGQVDAVTRKGNANEVRITVTTSFKNVGTNKLTLKEDLTWGNMNGPSEVGEVYLFYLNRVEGEWSNPLCSPTMKLAGAAAELEFLKGKEVQLQIEAAPAVSEEQNGDGALYIQGAALLAATLLAGLLLYRFDRRSRTKK